MKYTIAIPAYKSEFLKDCIQSILVQTFEDFELIIVNDASPENIDEIVHSFSDHRIRYYKNEENFGAENVVMNWNKCLDLSRGDYFLLMGDDDMLSPNYLMSFSQIIEINPEFNVFHCQTIIIDHRGNEIMRTPNLPPYESITDMIKQRLLQNRGQYISDFVYRTESLKSFGGFFYLPLAQMSDDISAYRSCGTIGISNVSEYLLFYRQHDKTISSIGNEELIIKALSIGEKWILRNFHNMSNIKSSPFSYLKLRILILISFHKKKMEVLNRKIKLNGLSKKSIQKLIVYKNSGQIYYLEVIHILLSQLRRKLSK